MNTIPPTSIPYTVPHDYFDSLGSQVMDVIRLSDNADIPLSVGKVDTPYHVPNTYWESITVMTDSLIKDVASFERRHTAQGMNPFSIPNGYLDNLADAVLSRIHHDDEDLVDTSLIDACNISNPYKVSKEYFDSLESDAQIIAADLHEVDANLLATVGNHTPYTLPNSYFENLSTDGDHHLKASVCMGMPYNIPEYYFASIDPRRVISAAQLSENANQYKKPVILSLRKVKWAAAAGLALIFSLGGMMMVDDASDNSPHMATSQKLSAISKDDITQYIKTNIDDFDLAMIEKVTVENNIDINNADKILDDVNDDDIKEFLELEGI